MRLIDAEFTKRLAERLIKDEEECYNTSPKSWAEEIENFKCLIDSIPTIEAYTGAEYMHLLKLAKKMHTWIFLHTFNEDETYKELGLTDEDNALLGSFGKFYYSCNPNSKPFPQAHENGNHIAEAGKKEPICGYPQEGINTQKVSVDKEDLT